jgi:PKD repeat protein
MTPDPVVGVPVEFEVDMTPDNMSMPYNYEIDMGDGTVYTGDSSDDPHGFSHIYTEAGTYMVEFRAWNCGMTEPMTDSMEITVSEAISRYYLPIVVKNY